MKSNAGQVAEPGDRVEQSIREQLVDVATKCYCNEDLMTQYERLRGERPVINMPNSPIAAAIDRAVGYHGVNPSPVWDRFIEFVIHVVFIPLKAKQVEDSIDDIRKPAESEG